jgi:hypothetical protein
MTGTGNHFRLISMEAMDENLSQCLPGFHTFSGRVGIQGTDFFISLFSYL